MARQTNTRLREKVIYSVFVRNHTKEGTFQALEGDLDRLAALGTDIIWLMPIHPIGEAGRKGTLGSPYAIRDFRGINPEYGTLGDFMHLVGEIHKRGMKCIIDVVYNHTSPDSILATGHPEFFLRDEAGNPIRKVADWSDVVDLDYSNRELWKYQIETLKIWAEIVDGFRCDVASAVLWPSGGRHGSRWSGCAPAASGWPRASMPPTRWPCAGRATTAPPTRSCMMPLISPTTTISGPISRAASSPPALSGSIRRW